MKNLRLKIITFHDSLLLKSHNNESVHRFFFIERVCLMKSVLYIIINSFMLQRAYI